MMKAMQKKKLERKIMSCKNVSPTNKKHLNFNMISESFNES